MGRLSFLRSTPGAARSLRIDPFPGVIAERDTSIGLAVGGPDAMTAAGWRRDGMLSPDGMILPPVAGVG